MQSSSAAPAVPVRPRVEELESRLAPAVIVRLDYTYDTHGFFDDPIRRTVLEGAVAELAPRLQDNLAAITPTGGNTWTASFFNPVTNSNVTLNNPTIGQNELVLYVAGAPIGSDELGLATTGGFSARGSRAWLDTVRSRGQAGALGSAPTDYSSWGGMITFDSSTRWYFGSGTPGPTQFDFESVALHELMHIFGFGLGEPAFTRHISGGQFLGPAVVTVAGGGVSVVGNPADHWAPGTRFQGQESPVVPSLSPGTKRPLTALEFAVLDDIGWDVSAENFDTSPSTRAPAVASPATSLPALPPSGEIAYAIASGVMVTGYNSSGQPVYNLAPFGSSVATVRVATADVTGDGSNDLIVGTGAGPSARVAVYDGRSGSALGEFTPFEPGFTGGIFVTTGDFNDDGRPDLVITPDQSGGPVVAIYDGASAGRGQGVEVSRFFGINDPNFRGGARAATGDINRDGTPDLVISAGFGGGPRIAVFNGEGVRTGRPTRLVADFFAFEPTLRNGAYVAVADTDRDGFGELIAGAGPGGAPRVIVFGARALLAGAPVAVGNFFAGDVASRGGVRVATLDVDRDGRLDLLTGSGTGGVLQVFESTDLIQNSTPLTWLALTLPGALPDGIYVG